jgi:hypothetical protein
MLNRSDWLSRYKTRFMTRCPHLTEQEGNDLANLEAHEDLSAQYPDNPEAAADDEIDSWEVCTKP